MKPYILGVSPIYPTSSRPELGTFVRSIMEGMVLNGAKVNVVAPLSYSQSMLSYFKSGPRKYPYVDQSQVRRDKYISVSIGFFPWKRIGFTLNNISFQRVIEKYTNECNQKFDFVYAHFFFSGLACLRSCQHKGLPLIVGLGESDLAQIEQLAGKKAFSSALQNFSGIIAVSKQNEDFCRSRVPQIGKKLIHLPNGVDIDKFKVVDQTLARQQLGLPLKERIVIFVGHFIPRKGATKVQEALQQLDNVKGIFLGHGGHPPSGQSVLKAGVVPHSDLPLWLSAADAFVLPSLAEGMSNAILEALACGLPVIVSDRAFNREYLTEDCAEFVEPESIQSIAKGIKSVIENEDRRFHMIRAARQLAEKYSLKERTRMIIEFGMNLGEAQSSFKQKIG